jgi:hypothetical protein
MDSAINGKFVTNSFPKKEQWKNPALLGGHRLVAYHQS